MTSSALQAQPREQLTRSVGVLVMTEQLVAPGDDLAVGGEVAAPARGRVADQSEHGAEHSAVGDAREHEDEEAGAAVREDAEQRADEEAEPRTGGSTAQ